MEVTSRTTTNAVVSKRLTARDCSDGFLLYGYPRTVGQVHHLDHLLSQQRAALDAVLCFEVDDADLSTDCSPAENS